jgi:hypothetical protein
MADICANLRVELFCDRDGERGKCIELRVRLSVNAQAAYMYVLFAFLKENVLHKHCHKYYKTVEECGMMYR